MNPDDDPEKRIRDLERPLTDQARELGTTEAATGWQPPPPPPPQGYYGPPMPPPSLRSPSSAPRIGWIVLVLLVIGLFAGGGAIVWSNLSNRSSPGIPTISGGGGTFTTATRPSRTVTPTPPGPGLGPGGTVSIAGVNQNKTIACDNSTVTISGMQNTIAITGHCNLVQVSGMNNIVTIDDTDNINVSGMDNRITFRNGAPTVDRSGFGNTVERG